MKLINQSLIVLLMVLSNNCEASVPPQSRSTAEGPSYAAISAAISAAQPGDTVTIPAGRAVWDQPLVITKSINLIGAGIDQTVITSNYTNTKDTVDPTRALISFKPATPAENPSFRLSGMTIDCNSKCDGVWLYNSSVLYPCTKIRLDHLRITNAKYAGSDYPRVAVGRYGTVYGVCDNCYLNGMLSNTSIHEIWANAAYNFGDEFNFYYEDCEWNAGGLSGFVCDGNQSPRYCLRHNTIDMSTTIREYISPMCDLHGNQIPAYTPTGGYHASQGGEVYDNTLLIGSKGVLAMDQRGGKVLFYNNTATGTGSLSLRVREEHDDRENPTGTTTRGVAGENLLTGQPQHISDSFYWNNTLNGTVVNVAASAETITYPDGLCPSLNVHFWNQNSSFNGTAGIGVGPLANRPNTCTIGVAYWATDTKTLYRCTATDVWTEYYKPYPYPHPLRNAL